MLEQAFQNAPDADKIGWGTEPYGSWNYLAGEYETCRFFTVRFLIPIWFSYRGCVHLIDPNALRRKGDYERLRPFLRQAFGLTDSEISRLDIDIHIPLRRSKVLIRMFYFYWLLWILGLFGGMGAFGTTVVLLSGRAFFPGEAQLLAVLWAIFALFLFGLYTYLRVRKVNARQLQIRRAIAQTLGLHSDIAGWDRRSATLVANSLRVVDVRPDDVMRRAEESRAKGALDWALLYARLALGLASDSERQALLLRAEAFTDACLDSEKYLPDATALPRVGKT